MMMMMMMMIVVNIHYGAQPKPTHTGQYLSSLSNHSSLTKQGIIRTLYNRASKICSTEAALNNEIFKIKEDLKKNGYSERLIETTISKCKQRKQPLPKDEKVDGPLLILPYQKGTSENIRRVAKTFNIKTAFTSKQTLRSLLCKTKPGQGQNDKKNCIYQIPCECGDSYIGETKRPLEVRVQEHQKFTRMGETSRSGLAEHAWTNGHNIHWSEAKILHKEENWRKRKFKEAVYIAQGDGVFSHPSVEIPSVWRPLLERNRPIRTEGGVASHIVPINSVT